MKIAFISDIHGNYEALRAVITDIKKLKIKKIYCLGDIVNYYYEPHKCIDVLIKNKVKCIKGNHEDIFLKTIKHKKKIKFYKQLYGKSIEINLKVLKNKHIKFLKSLKSKISIRLNGKKILLAHGSPWKIDFYFYKNVREIWYKKIATYKFDNIILGHTHYPMKKILNNKILILNPGSVGQPRNKSIDAHWIFLDTEKMKYFFKKSEYSKKKLLKQINQYDSGNSKLLRYFKK